MDLFGILPFKFKHFQTKMAHVKINLCHFLDDFYKVLVVKTWDYLIFF